MPLTHISARQVSADDVIRVIQADLLGSACFYVVAVAMAQKARHSEGAARRIPQVDEQRIVAACHSTGGFLAMLGMTSFFVLALPTAENCAKPNMYTYCQK